MNHKSYIDHERFEFIKKGKKHVEIFLNNKDYHVDDTIKLIDETNENYLIVRITSLSYYFNVDDLVEDYPVDLLGFGGKNKDEVKDFYHHLYEREEENYHVVGISFEITYQKEE